MNTELAARKTQVYDFIKVVAEILVVLQHITAMYSPTTAIAQAGSSRALSAIFYFLAAVTMPIFMCICGAVYNYCISIGKYQNRLKFIGNKFMRLMVPYYVFSVFMVAPIVVGLNVTYWDFGEFLIKGTLLGGLTRHLWFCISLFVIFIICALIKDTLQKASPFIILTIVCIMSYIGTRWSSPYFQLHQTLYFSLYFYVGMLIDRWWPRFCGFFRRFAPIFMLLGAGLCSTVYLLGFYKYYAAFGGILLIFAVAVCVNTPRLEEKPFYRRLKKDSFGVYLLHPMLLYLLFYYFRNSPVNPYLLSVLSFVGIYALTMLLTELIRKLHLGVIIGEKAIKKRENP